MSYESDASSPSLEEESTGPEVRQLSKPQRRILGVLLEKGFTTPESYPLTLKALTTGCNQKSNRSPLSSYEEGSVYDSIEELREIGLTAVVHTGGGRTERFRHYARKKFPFNEPQLAIITELLLRGRQSLGELRARSSRMVSIDSLTDLRRELEALMSAGFIQATAALERRGTEVDHTFYEPQEAKELPVRAGETASGSGMVAKSNVPQTASNPEPSEPSSPSVSVPSSEKTDLLTLKIEEIRDENRQQKEDIRLLQENVQELTLKLEEIRRDLGL